ncbi:uncharacterized protein LOC123535594 [Mercenaria mercenaria]|uniref:uncharacterized protein LOC123535594 n=1 Tax=Mercenaria mercenaria TaxID=6596 RepID=UPI00234E624E|nr:uncharacterized protein LOC123535594 [Mercenaria mercenaria]
MNKQKRLKVKMTSKPGTSTDKSSENSETAVQIRVFKKIKYPPAGKSDKILEKLHVRRPEGEFCDVQLKYSNSKTVHAHKSILATCSPYFEGMFGSAFLEATSEVVDLSHITDREDVLENVIDTFYGRTFEINEENVSETLNLATMLLLDDLKTECATVLFGLAHVRSAAQMLQLSINFDLRDLREKVLPMVYSRFHDYILCQDDLLDLSVEGFEFLVTNINTSYIARRAKYIEFILKWFLICESDERAKLLKKAIKRIGFKITKHAYKEFEDILEDVINHLDDANSDVSEEIKLKLSKRLPRLKPNDYIKNPSPEPGRTTDDKSEKETRKKEESDSELEDEPEKELYNTFGARLKVSGPPTKAKGFTKEEEETWKKAHEEMADRDQHRIWAKQWPMDLLNRLGTHNDPNRPKKIKRESPPEFFKSRNRRVKTEEELAEEANLVHAVVVLSPSLSYLKRMESNETKSCEFDDDMLEVCAYIPRKHAWYKVTSLSATSLKKRFNTSSMRDESTTYRRRSRPDDSDDDDCEDEEEAFHLSAMMDMYGADMPEMVMMMRGMPSSRRRRIMEEAARGRMPPSMLRRMMEMDVDEDDDRHRREYMMMREMSRMYRRRGPFGMEMMHMMRPRTLNIPSFTDPKWNAVYLKHRLYFYHQDIRDMVFCYDILNQTWYKSSINYTAEKQEPYYTDLKDGIELIVMGQILYAVLRIAVFDTRRDYHWKSKEDKTEDSKRQEVIVKHAVFKMIGELGNAKWEKVMENDGHHEYIPIDKEKRLDPDKERHGHPFMDFYEMGPMLRQPEALRTILYAEDEEKLYVCCAVRKRYYKDESIVGYSISHIDTMYLDLKENEHLLHSPDRTLFLRTLTPLYGDDLVAFLSDDIKSEVMLDLGKPGVWSRVYEWGRGEPEQRSEFLEARKQYPRCQSLQCSAGDGRSIWILRGKENDTSETVEITATMFYQSRKCKFKTTKHPPPPFRCFTMAMAARIDKTLVRTFSPSTKYLHSD